MKALQPAAILPPLDASSPVEVHQLYRVCIGNGAVCYFSSTRHAAQFAAALNTVANTALLECNVLLADVYPAWRLAWPYLDDPERDVAASMAITDATKAMDRALKRRGGTDFVFHSWKDLQLAVAALRDLILLLRNLYQAKGHGVDRFRMELHLDRANALRERLRQYGSQDDAPNAVVVTPPRR